MDPDSDVTKVTPGSAELSSMFTMCVCSWCSTGRLVSMPREIMYGQQYQTISTSVSLFTHIFVHHASVSTVPQVSIGMHGQHVFVQFQLFLDPKVSHGHSSFLMHGQHVFVTV